VKNLTEKYSGKTCYDAYLCRSEIESFKSMHELFIGKPFTGQLADWLSDSSKRFHSRTFYRDDLGFVTGVKFRVHGVRGTFYVGNAQERSATESQHTNEIREGNSYILMSKSKLKLTEPTKEIKPTPLDVAENGVYTVLVVIAAIFVVSVVWKFV